MAKKRAKTDARKADTERMRAETGVIRQTTSPVVTMPLTGQKIANPQSIASSGGTNKITAAGFSGNAIIIVIGVLLTGGYLYLKNKKAIHSPLPDSAL